MKRLMVCCIGLSLMMILGVTGIAFSTDVQTETLIVRQVNEQGFGDQSNQYAWSMESFKGNLYVGTLNHTNPMPGMMLFFLGLPVQSNGTQVVKGTLDENNDWTWETVLINGNGNPNNYGIRKLKVIGDYLYGLVANHIDGFELWRTYDGTVWEVVMAGGFDNGNNTSGRGLSAHNGYLYIGVENRKEGAKIYRSAITDNGDLVDAGTFNEVVSGGLHDKANFWFSDFVTYKEWLYCGTLNPSGMQLYRTKDGLNYEKLFDGGNGKPANVAAMKLYVYQDKLYVGTMNFLQGASLFASTDSDGTVFEPILTHGNGIRNNAYVWYMKEFNNRLYVGTFKTFGEFDLYSSENPGVEPWVVETDSAFGNLDHYGIRSMTIFNDKLMIGSATTQDDQACIIFEATALK